MVPPIVRIDIAPRHSPAPITAGALGVIALWVNMPWEYVAPAAFLIVARVRIRVGPAARRAA
ncbi:hypothetical protein ABZ990_18005 [Streptomyces sp. NPDC046203]|uniref:hypothetical protein n=1 Tax=Streptomyces sp. NPDC046203 TaxID=3154602 RepID=UPI00340A66C9